MEGDHTCSDLQDAKESHTYNESEDAETNFSSNESIDMKDEANDTADS